MNETNVVKYKAKDGQDIALDFQTVKNYLVQGKRDLVTPQEVMFFLGMCKSKGLNPFKKDVYLVKYDSTPAAIVTSIDYYRSRARAQADCKGWKKGVIVKDAEGNIKRTNGLILEEETLLGGWFTARPQGWDEPFELEVNLDGFIKTRQDGKPTQFWIKPKQPLMIMKVAESQGLRTLWPDEFEHILAEDEVIGGEGQVIEAAFSTQSAPPPADTLDTMVEEAKKDKKLPPGIDLGKFSAYLDTVAANSNKTKDEIKMIAASRFSEFMTGFATYCKRLAKDKKEKAAKEKAEKEKKAKAEKEKKEQAAPPTTEAPAADPGTIEMKDCPDKGEKVDIELCKGCSIRMGCPSWAEEDAKTDPAT